MKLVTLICTTAVFLNSIELGSLSGSNPEKRKFNSEGASSSGGAPSSAEAPKKNFVFREHVRNSYFHYLPGSIEYVIMEGNVQVQLTDDDKYIQGIVIQNDGLRKVFPIYQFPPPLEREHVLINVATKKSVRWESHLGGDFIYTRPPIPEQTITVRFVVLQTQ